MNKKLLITLLLGVMSLVLVNAALVGYLSNKVTAEVEVKSPIVQSISDSIDGLGEGLVTLSLPDMYTGGEKTFTFYVETKNIADVEITGNVENIVTNWKGITCEDFQSVVATTEPDVPYDLIALDLCEAIDDNHVKFSYGPVPIVWIADQVDITEIVVTFNDVIGKYTFTSQVVPQ